MRTARGGLSAAHRPVDKSWVFFVSFYVDMFGYVSYLFAISKALTPRAPNREAAMK